MNWFQIPRTAIPAVALTIILSLCGCDDGSDLSPPAVHCGRDTCAECGMIINEARFAAAITVDNDGILEHQLFDDIGDMFDYESSHSSSKILARYVQDFAGAGWVPAESARYIVSKEIHTPMGSGLVAFAGQASADKALGKPESPTIGIADARESRAAHRRERGG